MCSSNTSKYESKLIGLVHLKHSLKYLRNLSPKQKEAMAAKCLRIMETKKPATSCPTIEEEILEETKEKTDAAVDDFNAVSGIKVQPSSKEKLLTENTGGDALLDDGTNERKKPYPVVVIETDDDDMGLCWQRRDAFVKVSVEQNSLDLQFGEYLVRNKACEQ